MVANANLARLHGERIGHLSRYDSIDLLREELAAISGLLQAAPVRFAFRKAFFGAGGKQEHWDRYASPLLEANVSSPMPPGLSTPLQVVMPAPAAASVALPPMSEQQLTVALAAASEPTPEQERALEEAEVPEESLPWDQLTAGLAEAAARVEHTSASDLPKKEKTGTALLAECSMSVSQLADRGLAVKVEGSFGAGAYGGSRFLEEVNNAVQAGTAGVLLDLSGLRFLRPDCSAPILACQIKVQAVGGRLAVVQPTGGPLAILDATGLTERIDCFEDEQSAAEFLQPVCENAPVV